MSDEKPWLPSFERPVSLAELVKAHMIRKALGNERRFHIFHPSAWGSCLRKIAYQYYNDEAPFIEKTPNDVDDRMERIFDNGHATHARWQNYLDQAGVLRGVWRCSNPLCYKHYGKGELLGIFNPSTIRTGPERGETRKDWVCECGSKERLEYEEATVKSDAKFNFTGHCDAIIDVRGTEFETGKFDIFVADLKTIKDDMYSELKEPKPEHVIQVNIYMWILGLSAAVVVYENKDNQALKEMFVPRDDEMIEKIQQQSLWLQDKLSKKQLPFRPKEFSRSTFPCRLCEFVSFCYGS